MSLPLPKANHWPLAARLFALGLFVQAGCGKYPAPLRTANDIARTPAATAMVSVRELPLEHFPLLAKFTKLKQIKFYHPDGVGASDEKLQALARLNLPQLKDVNLLNCPAVTDEGLEALGNIASIELLQLEGTSITDESLETLARKLRLKGINVANCPKVTLQGLSALAAMDSLLELTFSVENLSQRDVVDLVHNFRAVKWCTIVDVTGKLEGDSISRLVPEKPVNVSVRRQGALQNVRDTQ